MQLFRSSAGSGTESGGNCWKTAAVLMAAIAATTTVVDAHPVRAQQDPARGDALRNFADLQVLGTLPGDADALSLNVRLALQRRSSLRRSLSLSGLFLQDALSQTTGVAAGSSLRLSLGGLLLEPFAEVGAGFTDARVPSGSVRVESAGGGVQDLVFYDEVGGLAGIFGAGIWAGIPLGNTAVARLGLGYWQVQGRQGLSRGGLRAGVSLGLAGEDRAWYAVASDEIPPAILITGLHPADADSVAVGSGQLRIHASDENGIRRILLDGDALPLEPASAQVRTSAALPEGAVTAEAEVETVFEGTEVQISVEDRGGNLSRRTARVFGADDTQGPTLTYLEPHAGETASPWSIRIRADDPAGVAYATLGRCELAVLPLDPLSSTANVDQIRSREMGGWSSVVGSGTVMVMDRAGNMTSAEVQLPAVASRRVGLPQLEAIQARRRANGAGAVRVRGIAVDPAGGWVTSVRVEGAEAMLVVGEAPWKVAFSGWADAPDVGGLEVVVTTADGRVLTEDIPVESDPVSAPQSPGLHVVWARDPGSQGERSDAPLAALEAGGVRLSTIATPTSPAELLDAIANLARTVSAGDVVWVHLDGTLAGLPVTTGPSLRYGRELLSLGSLDVALRKVGGDALLVTSNLATSASWRVQPPRQPGVLPPPGCLTATTGDGSSAVGVGGVTAEAVAAALAGAADLDGSGTVSIGEVLDFLDAAGVDGLLPYNPLAGVPRGEGRR